MLEGYKPIDFSSVFPPMELGKMRNRVGLSQAAMNILSNSKWSNAPISSMLDAGLNSRGEAPKRKQSLWGRVVDLLSVPTYGIANAVDDAIAGHQSDDTDSVTKDIGQILGGIATGGGRGIATGFRGAFAPSETAANPQDKIYLDNALIRFDTHMSAEDAMKPENREKVRKRLMGKKINQFSNDPKDKYFYDWDKGKVEVTDHDIDQYFNDMHKYGVVASMVGDPINFISAPAKVANLVKGGEGASEVPDIISGSKNTFEGFKSLPKMAESNKGMPAISPGAMAIGKSPGSYKVSLGPGSIQNKIATPEGLVTPPAWFDEAFPRSATDMTVTTGTKVSPVAKNVTDPLDNLLGEWSSGIGTKEAVSKVGKSVFPVAKVPKEQVHLAQKLSMPKETTKLASDLLRRSVTDGVPNAIARLGTAYPGIKFEKTSQLLDHLNKLPDLPKRISNPAERKKIAGAFHRVIRADAEAMKIPQLIRPAEAIVNDADATVQAKLVDNAKPRPPVPKNPKRDATVANDVYQKFLPQILGKARPSGIRNPAAYDTAVATGRTARYSGSQQVQMWNHITHVMKKVKSPARFAVANSILRQVEDLYMAKKAVPMSGFKVKDSVPLRLSQVLDSIGPAAAAMSPTLLTKILRGEPEAIAMLSPEVLQKIEDLKAGESLVDGSKVIQGVDAASKNIDELIKGPLSAARTGEIVTIGSKVAEDITRAAGGSPVAGLKAGEATKAEFLNKAPGDGFSVTNTTAMISHPDVSGKLIKRYSSAPAVAKAINRAIGGPSPKQLGKLFGSKAMVPEWLGARFNAAYKNADMRPIYLREAATAKSTVAKRAEYLNGLAKSFDVNDADLWNDALKAAQGRMAPLPGTPAEQLSREILKTMENLFGSSGLKASVAIENSVIGRSQLFMSELNKNLRRFGLGKYQFAAKNEYSDGVKWLNSWESWEIEKPLEFLFRIQNVVEHTVREKLMFDDIIGRFGTYTRAGEFNHTVNHPRLANVYFGKEAAGQVNQFVKNLKEISTPNSKAMQNFDKVLSKWKAGVTIYVPSHHIRNVIGDVYFNWLGGVTSLRPYGTALKVMKSQKGRYEGLEEIGNLTSPNAVMKAMSGGVNSPVGKQTAFTMRNGTNVTNDMVYVSAFQHGILPTTRVLEDIPDDAARGLEKFKPLGGKAQKAAHTISEGRDHYVRLAHYIDSIKKSGKSFEQAVEDATGAVRKWHPDGMDLTTFERNVMRRVFPFYSWTRKALPLIIESLVAQPGKIMAIPKAEYTMQQMLGIQTGPMSDPFPYDQLFPDWITEKGIGPIAGPESALTGFLGGEPGYTVANPGNPANDLIAQINHPGTMAMGMVNPAARIPIELATGEDTQTHAPVSITDTDYLAKQLPGISHVGRISGQYGVSDATKENSPGYNIQNILNIITGLGIQNTGPYKKSAQFDLRDYLRSLK